MTTDPDTTADLDVTAELDAATRERIARLQARRDATGATGATASTGAAAATTAASPGRRRRRHPAKNSRIAATAVGFSAMFGLMAAYGVAAQADGPELTEVAPPVPAHVEPIVIQVRLVGLDGTSVASSAAPPAGGPAPAAERQPAVTAPAAPVAVAAPATPVTAAPEVRVLSAPSAPAPAAPAPVVEASTNGSR